MASTPSFLPSLWNSKKCKSLYANPAFDASIHHYGQRFNKRYYRTFWFKFYNHKILIHGVPANKYKQQVLLLSLMQQLLSTLSMKVSRICVIWRTDLALMVMVITMLFAKGERGFLLFFLRNIPGWWAIVPQQPRTLFLFLFGHSGMGERRNPLPKHNKGMTLW